MQRGEGEERAVKITHARVVVVLPQLHAPKAGSLPCGCSGDAVAGTSHRRSSTPRMPSLLYTHPLSSTPVLGVHTTKLILFNSLPLPGPTYSVINNPRLNICI